MAGLSPEDRATKDRVPLLSFVVRRLRTRRAPLLPHEGPIDGEQRTGGKSGALRAAIFGANDGLVSNLSLIMGVAGAGVDHSVVILAGVAGLLAGAFSMAAGEYISMRVQREVFERLIHLEAHEIGSDHAAERKELAELYERKGISPELADRLAEELMRDPKVALETHAREELGLDEQGLGSPWAAAGSSFATFAVGAILPLVRRGRGPRAPRARRPSVRDAARCARTAGRAPPRGGRRVRRGGFVGDRGGAATRATRRCRRARVSRPRT